MKKRYLPGIPSFMWSEIAKREVKEAGEWKRERLRNEYADLSLWYKGVGSIQIAEVQMDISLEQKSALIAQFSLWEIIKIKVSKKVQQLKRKNT